MRDVEREKFKHKILLYFLPLGYNAVLHLEPHYSTIVFFFTIVVFYNIQWRGYFGLNGKRMVKGAYIWHLAIPLLMLHLYFLSLMAT